MAGGLKFQIKEEEGLYYPCIENNGADQLCGYKADLRLCFLHMQKASFLMMHHPFFSSDIYLMIRCSYVRFTTGFDVKVILVAGTR